MTRLLVTGGRQRQAVSLEPLQEWRLYDQARLLELDTESGEVRVRLAYVSPPGHAPSGEPAFVFKAGCVDGDELWLTTQTEVLLLDRETLDVREVRSHPWFNDVHHACRIAGRLHVVSTGLDRVLVLDEGGEVAAVRPVLPEREVREIEEGVDYRLVATTKPHASHPNYAFETEHGVWVTRFEQRDALCLDRPELRLDIGVERPHDGIRSAGSVWFTTVDGHLVEFDASSLERRSEHDLAEIAGAEEPLGWCRGLWLEGDLTFVGFSRIRYTRFRRNLSWIRHGFRSPRGYTSRPTRIMAFDLGGRSVVGEWDLEPHELNAVFSILPA